MAALQPASAKCDAGLWEVVVPVLVGTQVVGHLVVAGIADGAASIRDLNRVRHLLARKEVEVTAETLERLRNGSPTLNDEGRAALGRLLHAVAEQAGRLFTEHLVSPTGSAPALVEQAYHHVHVEYTRRLRVPSLAQALGVSAAHLSRSFHRVTGLRLVDYISRYRAERARQLLLESEQPIASVAEACGFQSLSQFNRVFRAVYGQSPRELRRGSSERGDNRE